MALHAPEGECILLNYRISGDFELPFRVYPLVEQIDEGRTDIVLKIRADIPEANAGASVVSPPRLVPYSCSSTLVSYSILLYSRILFSSLSLLILFILFLSYLFSSSLLFSSLLSSLFSSIILLSSLFSLLLFATLFSSHLI